MSQKYNPALKKLIQDLNRNIDNSTKLFSKAESLVDSLENYLIESSSTSSEEFEDEFKGVKINDRVVWMVRDQPDLGTVKWVGLMSDGLVAGVEFDEAIGNSDGNLDGKKLFLCKPRHGRFVLVRELILWSDFSGERVK